MSAPDLRALLDPASRGDHVVVHGVRCGEPAERLAGVAWTSADGDDVEGEPRAYRSGRVYRIVGDREVEIPLAERVASVLGHRGWLRDEYVAIRVEEGRVARIVVRGPALGALGIRRVEDVEERLGPSEGVARARALVIHHYPARALVVAWSERSLTLDHVVLGPDDWRAPRHGAKQLLAELVTHWRALEQHGWQTPPTGSIRARHQRIAALARALGLGTVEDVALGRFLERSPEAHAPLLAEMAARGMRPEARSYVPADIVFEHLLRYRVDAERVLSATSGWLECGDPALLGMIATQNAIAAKLRAELAPIDAWLCVFLDPAERTFPERDLVARWGWPDVDVHELEMDEL